MRHVLTLFAVLYWLSLASLARAAAPAQYFGHHPVPAGKGAFCVVSGSHTHTFAPDSAVAHLFRAQGGHFYFVGDPYHFGYNQPAYGFDGHHPVHAAFGGGWCYLDGPHHHFFHPHKDDVRQYTTFGGRYYYLGAVGPEYATQRPALYVATPPYATVAAYAPVYDARFQYALSYGRPASVAYVVGGRLPKRYFVPGVYGGAYFGVPGFSAGFAVGMPGVSAHVGVALPGVSVGFGVAPMGPGVLVAGGPGYYGPGYYGPRHRGWHPGKKKGWYKHKARNRGRHKGWGRRR